MLLAVAACGIWIGAEKSTKLRPRYRDEQTLVGGTIWSQTIITLGLIISELTDDNLPKLIHGFFVVSGILLFLLTGVMLIVYELKIRSQELAIRRDINTNGSMDRVMNAMRRTSQHVMLSRTFNMSYFCIGVVCILGSNPLEEKVSLELIDSAIDTEYGYLY
ncbi:uncharacterized protein LOC125231251 [Leguminivora glycinivorella]|uniref:uncharacterized protein LOC125231251 n=1 Tax=Leguminivora glycinivorella TaxID=1035111 RepID=UPI00200D9020|nr:uncharacterized protein LOC125231251 [Leguminivora glycinivorella]